MVARSKQAGRYLDLYSLVIVTNLQDFALVERDADLGVRVLERHTLASSESEFWEKAANPVRFASAHEVAFGEFLARAILTAAPLSARRKWPGSVRRLSERLGPESPQCPSEP